MPRTSREGGATGGLCRSTAGTESQCQYGRSPEAPLLTPIAGLSAHLSLIDVSEWESCGSAA